ncbi:hypothetical protein ACS0TY_019245 [Phlomoides rotata]
MASYLHRVILIFALFLSIAIPISIGHKETSKNKSDDFEPDSDDGDDSEIERYLRDLCSDTKKSKQCWKIIKPEISRFTDTDSRNVIGVVLDLAIAKSDEIHELLNQLHSDSGDDSLKEKYESCANNYEQARNNLGNVHAYMSEHDYYFVQECVNVAAKNLKSCEHQFGKTAFDPAHIRDRNKEFGRYMEIVKTAKERFLRDVNYMAQIN